MRIVLSAKNVKCPLEAHYKNYGIFSLAIIESNYCFHWIPDPSRPKEDLQKHHVPNQIIIPFSQIAEIIRQDKSMKRINFRFILTDSSQLLQFQFYEFSFLFVNHLLEFLEYKHLISPKKQNSQDFLNSFSYIINNSVMVSQDIDQFGSYEKEDTITMPQQASNLLRHNFIISKLCKSQEKTSQISLNEMYSLFTDKTALKNAVFSCGCTPESRPYIWAYLLGIDPYHIQFTNEINKSNNNNYNEINSNEINSNEINSNEMKADYLKHLTTSYLQIKMQSDLITPTQIKLSSTLHDIQRVIENDVQRNDRKIKDFSGDDNPNLELLRHVLTTYAFYNHDTSYCQGMTDLVTPFIVLFIKSWKENPNLQIKNKEENMIAIFYDGSEKTADEAEAWIFWAFVTFMEMTQQDLLFANLEKTQDFVLQLIADIATEVHPPLAELLGSKEFSDVSFMFRIVLLLFKRKFRPNELYRLWDSIISSPIPSVYPRFIAASILITLYPKILISAQNSLGDAMSIADTYMESDELEKVFQITNTLLRKSQKPTNRHQKYYESIPRNTSLVQYRPKYLNFVSI